MHERLRKLSDFAETMGHLYFGAQQKIEIFDGLQNPELRDRLADSHGMHAHSAICRILTDDLIRDVWAFTLDRDARAPSISNLWNQLRDGDFRDALREQFDDSNALEWWGPELPSAERERRMQTARRDRRAAAFQAFDQVIQRLEIGIPALLESEQARRICKARNRVIAHYNMVKTPAGHAIFDISTLGLRWEDPREFLAQAAPIVLELAGIIARAGFDVAEYSRVHRLNAQDFWSRVMGNGSLETFGTKDTAH